MSFENIVVGYIEKCYKHPNADKLKVCEVDLGDNSNLYTIVCGAPNVKKGLLVPVATIGSYIEGIKIRKTKIRDIYSYGMICSGKELGINQIKEFDSN